VNHLLPWIYDDGGRKASGFGGEANDCVCRSIAIAAQQDYEKTYEDLKALGLKERITWNRRSLGRSHPHTHIWRTTYRKYLDQLGWVFVPTMFIGSGCRVRLAQCNLPENGRYVIQVSKHLTALVEGQIHDTYDPSREGTRCVYGYWRQI
jgi:hypothetical protein